MRRVWLVVIAACGSRAPSRDALERETASFNETAFATRLRAMQLEPIALGTRNHEIGEGAVLDRSTGGYPKSPPYPEGVVVTRDQQPFVAGPASWSGSANQPAPWEFVRDSTGKIFRVRRDPRVVETRQVRVDECEPQRSGSPCPACGTTDQVLYGPLTDATAYGGEVVVSYDAHHVEVIFERGVCHDPLPP